MAYTKVVIIGGGFGGLNAAKGLRKANVDLVLLDKANHHLFQPLLYQVATAALSPGNIASPIREILARQKNTTVYMAEIVDINCKEKYVEASNGDRFPYHYLILAPGANHSYFGHEEWEKIAPGLKTLSDALQIREKILLSYERAELCDSISHATSYLKFVIVGGGPTGIELAGAIAEISRISLIRNFRHIKPENSKIYLIEGEKQLLPAYPHELAEKARIYLEKMGVEVLLNHRVTEVTEEGVYLVAHKGQKFLESRAVLWAAGNQASPLLKKLNVPLDRSGRVIVNPDLSIPDHPDVFVIGDAAHFLSPSGGILPGLAPVAMQQGRYVAGLISKKIPVKDRPPFTYYDKGMMATVGKDKAVAVWGSWKMSGFLAWSAWCFVHIFYLISFPNRMLVLMQWMFWYVTNQRRVRLITRPVPEKRE